MMQMLRLCLVINCTSKEQIEKENFMAASKINKVRKILDFNPRDWVWGERNDFQLKEIQAFVMWRWNIPSSKVHQ